MYVKDTHVHGLSGSNFSSDLVSLADGFAN